MSQTAKILEESDLFTPPVQEGIVVVKTRTFFRGYRLYFESSGNTSKDVKLIEQLAKMESPL